MGRLPAALVLSLALIATSGVVAFGAAQSTPASPPLGAIGPGVTTVRLAGGGNGIVRPLGGSPVAAVQLWFRAPSIGFGADPKPGLAYVAAYAVAASRPLTGTTLSTTIARIGGRFAISVYPDTISISALVPATQAPAVLRAMTAVYFTPVLSDEGLTQVIATARQDARVRSIAAPEETLRNALFAGLFTNGPNHFSPTGDDGDPRKLTIGDVRAFATRAFRGSNATVVLTGAVDAQLADAAVEGRGEGGLPEAPAAMTAQVEKSPVATTTNAPISGFGYAWAGPPIANEREATALDFIADYLFNSDSGTVSRKFANADVAINAQYVTYFNPGVLYVEATGSDSVRARAGIDAALSALQTPLDQKTFDTARGIFEYHVTSDVASPVALADNFGWYASEGDAAYAPGADLEAGRYVRAIHSLTPQFVAATAAKYLNGPHAIATLTIAPEPAPEPMATDRAPT